ncbi:hypothetical protein V6x_43270 [Gimesia chilikensis]|uniref:HEAT repeat domain-containing protein n=1 Tax=Gimesia chilikensis TaxID=2605989 RepID=A0A517WH60_9PLAN|nr:HEAT repeat domain-containing protein [Gimesia chilikensis]QDU04599.1 hypothetical protein V6x_43270 [Gimesia chilikensis]
MNYSDVSPPPVPTPAEQRDALAKGLGRARLWAEQGVLTEEPLREACLQDLRYDHMCEDLRGDWLWEIINAAGFRNAIRVPLLHALYELSAPENARQLCKLAQHYAASGDAAFRDLLYQIVTQKPLAAADYDFLGESELLALEGERGFLCAAKSRGAQIKHIDWDWPEESLLREAGELIGETRIHELLSSTSDPDLNRFFESWQQQLREKAERKQQKQRHRKKQQAQQTEETSVETVLEAARGETHCSWFRSWGTQAAPTELNVVLQALKSSKEPVVLLNLIKVFANRALPEFDSRLIELCQHPDPELQRRAWVALANNSHPEIREFAKQQLNENQPACLFSLFIRNYEPGDENRLLAALSLPEDASESHSVLSDLIEVLKENPTADCSSLARVIYRFTPCEICRYKAVQLLHDRSRIPDWMANECRFDSYAETRTLTFV